MATEERKINIKRLSWIILVFLSVTTLAFSLASSSNLILLVGQILYLPIIIKQPTPTALPNPTETPTVGYKLEDGYYLAEFSNGGFIQFRISDNGTIASNAGFLFQEFVVCPWSIYAFDGSATVENGSFVFSEVDYQYREPLARLACHAISSTEASCNAREYGIGVTGCGSITGIASWRW